jgi:hypothetical protein
VSVGAAQSPGIVCEHQLGTNPPFTSAPNSDFSTTRQRHDPQLYDHFHYHDKPREDPSRCPYGSKSSRQWPIGSLRHSAYITPIRSRHQKSNKNTSDENKCHKIRLKCLWDLYHGHVSEFLARRSFDAVGIVEGTMPNTRDQTITINGRPSTVRFSPLDMFDCLAHVQ